MKMYVRGYSDRVRFILLVISAVVFSSLLNCIFFKGKLNNVSGQINTYKSSDYSVLYVLNYGNAFDNECVFPDTDIIVYKNAEGSERLSVSSVMKEEGVSYNLKYLSFMKNLQPNEICVSQNVADKYRLKSGDILYGEFSYTSDLIPLKIVSITDMEYDYTNPIIDNEMGVVFIGFDESYFINTFNNYLLYSDRSRSNELSECPQIIKEIINKSANEKSVIAQSVPAMMVEFLLTLCVIFIEHLIFFSKSEKLLFRCYLKGMNRYYLWLIPILEIILLCIIPSVFVQLIITIKIPDSYILTVYRLIPIMLYFTYTVAMLVRGIFKLRMKGQ